MRICSIVTSLTSGGAETLVANLSDEFSANGHVSFVIALCDASAVGNARDAEERLKKQIAAAGGRFVSLALPSARPLVSGALALRRALRELRPDVVHVHTARAALMLFVGQVRVPAILTHHNSVLGFSPTLFRLFDRVVGSYVAISQETRRMLEASVRRPVVQIVNAAGRGFRARAPRSVPSSPLRVLTVGTISDQKNYPLLIATAAALRDAGVIQPLPVFVVAGNGSDLDDLRRQVVAADLCENVSFLGERNDVAALMKTADVYLNTSRYEGMPIALLEAMRMGLPIIATDVAGNRELVAQGENGFLEAEDPVALASAITLIAGHPDLYANLSRGALRHAEKYSIGSAAALHLELYRSVCLSAARAGPKLSEGVI